jgi:hypothetical protein
LAITPVVKKVRISWESQTHRLSVMEKDPGLKPHASTGGAKAKAEEMMDLQVGLG